MNTINFINPITQQKQRALKAWLRNSLLFLLLVLTAIIVIQLKQQKKITQAQQAVNEYAANSHNFNDIIKKHALLKQHEELLVKQRIKIDQLLHNPKNPIAYLATIQQALGKEIILENLHISGATIELVAKCPNTTQVNKLVETLNKTPHFKQVAMINLTTHTEQGKKIMVITLKGLLIKNNVT